MKTLLISDRDLQSLVNTVGIDVFMDELIAQLREALRAFDPDQTIVPERTGFYYDRPTAGLLEWMPLFTDHQTVLMKMVGYHPHNPSCHQIPTIISTLSAYETTTGRLAALVDGTLLTAMRTGAASAIASELLARPGSETLGLIGCGAQAVTQFHALSRVFNLREVLYYDCDPAAATSLPQRIEPLAPSATSMSEASFATILSQSDIISVATSVDVGDGPVFDEAETRPWLHINAVGSDLPGKTELPVAMLRQSFVCPDNASQAKKEGECQQLTDADIDASMVDIVRHPSEFKPIQASRTVFDSTGWALEDQVALDLTLQYARELGIGRYVQIECLSDDPRNPYGFFDFERSNNGSRPSASCGDPGTLIQG